MRQGNERGIEFAAYIGIDWAEQKHACALQSSTGSGLEETELIHKPEAVRSPAKRFKYSWMARRIKDQARGLSRPEMAGSAASTSWPATPRNPAWVDRPMTVPNPHSDRP